jgi:hypothetical protein
MGVSIDGDTPKWMVYTGKSCQNGWFRGTRIYGTPLLLTFNAKNIEYEKNLDWTISNMG